jgi:hypothetical protein
MAGLFGFESLQDEHIFHEQLSWAIIYSSFPIFFVLYFVIPSQPWGKTASSQLASASRPASSDINISRFLGPIVPARIAWFVFECPNLLWSVVCFCSRTRRQLDRLNALLFALYFLHYVQRAVFYPLRMKTGRSGIPLATVASAFLYCSINGYLQARSLCEFDPLGNSIAGDPIVVVGLVLFVGGAALNLQSDAILRDLSAKGGGSGGYRIPFGGLFEYVSAPHFLGEIIEWGGYCLACHCTLSSLSFWLFTAANLIPRGAAHHRWYREAFRDSYPRSRKALIPFIW